ncbi:B30.2/SPRY domain-containing protein [Curvibacter phage PCA1]|nr:B30.2/SPRY domain-containing protein [Curvibacter phage PCA1]
MAARYWRVVGLATRSGGALQLTGAELWVGNDRSTFPVTCSLAPQQGSVANLSVVGNNDVVTWSAASASAPGFALTWDTLSDTTDGIGVRIKSGASEGSYPRNLVIQSSQNLVDWATEQSYNNLVYPGAFAESEFVSSGVKTYAKLNAATTTMSLSNDDLRGVNSSFDYRGALGNMPLSGKRYFEGRLVQNAADTSIKSFGIAPATVPLSGNQTNAANTKGLYMNAGTFVSGDSNNLGVTTSGHVLQVAFDSTTRQVWLGRNNVWFNSVGGTNGNPSTGENPTATLPPGEYLPWVFAYNGGIDLNFGQVGWDANIPAGYSGVFTQSGSGLITDQFANGLGTWVVTQSMYGGTGGTAAAVDGVLKVTSFGTLANSWHGPRVSKAVPAATDFDVTFTGVNFSTAPNDIVSIALGVGVPETPLKFWFWLNDAWDAATTGLEGWYFGCSSGTNSNTVFAETLVNTTVRLVRTGNTFRGYFNGTEVHSSSCDVVPVTEINIQFLNYSNYGSNQQSVASVTSSMGGGTGAKLMLVSLTEPTVAPSPILRLAYVDGDSDQAAGVQSADNQIGLSEVMYAGPGRIVGTVFEKGSPSNIAVRRKVRLHDERSGLLVQETWSDAITGAYQFKGIPLDTRYTVIGYDHTGAYRGVIADGQLAERVL